MSNETQELKPLLLRETNLVQLLSQVENKIREGWSINLNNVRQLGIQYNVTMLPPAKLKTDEIKTEEVKSKVTTEQPKDVTKTKPKVTKPVADTKIEVKGE